MEATKAIQIMSALAQGTRLEVFNTLARARPDGLSAGGLAERIGTPANTMSAHLAILSRAGLIASARSGRQIIYQVEENVMKSLATFLLRQDGIKDESDFVG